MYRCENCHALSRPGDRAVRAVLATREVTYQCGDGIRKGFETVREALVCPACAKSTVPRHTEGNTKLVDCEGCYTEPRHGRSHYFGCGDDARMDYARNVLPSQADTEDDIFWNWDPKANEFVPDYPSDRR